MRRLAPLLLAPILLTAPVHAEQDLLLGADMGSVAMTKAEMSRADVEALIAQADNKPIDLSDKALAGLDLSGLNLRGANLRTARLNKANLRGADLTGATVAGADFKNVHVSGARLVSLKGQDSTKGWSARVKVDRAITQAAN